MPAGAAIVALAVAGLAAVGGLVLFSARDRRLKRRIAKFPAFPIGQAPERSDMRISGALEYSSDEKVLLAPLSGRRCAAYRVVVKERRGSGKNSHYITVIDEDDATDFVLRDRSGVAFIDATLTTLAVDLDLNGGTGLFQDRSPFLEDFLIQRGIATKGLIFNKDFRFSEGVVEAGETVTVAGQGVWERDPSQRGGEGYRDVGKRLHVSALSSGEMLVSDDPKLTKG